MALVPLQTIFSGDFVVQLVPVDDQDTMDMVAQKVAYHVVGRRLPPGHGEMRVRFRGQTLPRDQTVAGAGIGPMDVIEVGYE
jgi:toluene monooxygenase system protein B